MSSSSSLASIKLLAQYNTLANRRIIKSFPNRQFASRRFNCLFFDTPHATINHIAGTTDLWLGRIYNEPERAAKYNWLYNTTSNNNLHLQNSDGENWLQLCPDFEKSVAWLEEISLEAERRVFDEKMTPEVFVGDCCIVKFENTSGQETKANPGDALVHALGTHPTHHRGQLHASLCEAGVKDCVLDLSFVVPIWKK